jgi:hypothetical protein
VGNVAKFVLLFDLSTTRILAVVFRPHLYVMAWKLLFALVCVVSVTLTAAQGVWVLTEVPDNTSRAWLEEHYFPVLKYHHEVQPQRREIDPATIINIGLKVWQFIKDNAPTIDVSRSSASAVPSGITNWDQLENWHEPRSVSYNLKYKNLLGMVVVDFTFKVVFIWGGQYKNIGQYITGATVVPTDIKVLWGYNFEAVVNIANVVNAGTTAAPLAAMTMEINWKVSNPLVKENSAMNFWISGDGKIKQI